MIKKKKFIIVAISGGVDSSVAALILKNLNFKIECIFMKNWNENTENNNCNYKNDIEDAQKICDLLKIKLHIVDFSKEYKKNVFNNFILKYQNGLTPNPDITCNKEIKFKIFLNYALQLGCDYIATGHYANIIKINNKLILSKSLDKNKDQTYFLYGLNQNQLKYIVFPLSIYKKKEVRRIAAENNFPNSKKKDSMGICFIEQKKFRPFFKNYSNNTTGTIIDLYENKIGKHEGSMLYTKGQRKGFTIYQNKKLISKNWSVIYKDIKKNKLIVIRKNENLLFFKKKIEIIDVNFIFKILTKDKITCYAKIRHGQKEQQCNLYVTKKKYFVFFKIPQKAPTPGQSIVFYKNNLCLGGGIIK